MPPYLLDCVQGGGPGLGNQSVQHDEQDISTWKKWKCMRIFHFFFKWEISPFLLRFFLQEISNMGNTAYTVQSISSGISVFSFLRSFENLANIHKFYVQEKNSAGIFFWRVIWWVIFREWHNGHYKESGYFPLRNL